MTRVLFVALSVAMLAIAAPTSGGADHINARVTSGSIVVGSGSAISGTFEVAGTSGFSFDAGFDSGHSEALCFPCLPGDTITVSSVMSPTYAGTARYRGKTYPFSFEFGGGWWSVSTPPLTLPDPEGPTAEFQVPFSVNDDSFLFLQESPDGTGHNVRLSGSGTATVRFTVTFDPFSQTDFYFFDSMRFDFAKK